MYVKPVVVVRATAIGIPGIRTRANPIFLRIAALVDLLAVAPTS